MSLKKKLLMFDARPCGMRCVHAFCAQNSQQDAAQESTEQASMRIGTMQTGRLSSVRVAEQEGSMVPTAFPPTLKSSRSKARRGFHRVCRGEIDAAMTGAAGCGFAVPA
ncbi:MAG: hypothetical protein ACLTQI_07120 [Slackia sp.]